MSVKGKTAVVTGSTSGIGLGIARALAAEGCNILLNGFGDEREIRAVGEDLAKGGIKTAYSPADMSKPADIRAMIGMAEEKLGGCDILVNNAGIQHVAAIDDFPDERWDAVIAINLSAGFHAIKAALPGMRRKGWGRIVNIASAHGLVASGQKVAYVAAKHGIVGLTKTVAIETAGSGVTCNAICPGWVLTPLVQKQVEARAKAQGCSLEAAKGELLGEKQPLKEFTTPEQIGRMVVFLSGDAARTTTGAMISMDGGWTAQ